ncbi:uncharacterized protein J3R85_018892 [Psidium guajava]|nr:uncharacterized protein J3R85_018892 [Psidium guajava]
MILDLALSLGQLRSHSSQSTASVDLKVSTQTITKSNTLKTSTQNIYTHTHTPKTFMLLQIPKPTLPSSASKPSLHSLPS